MFKKVLVGAAAAAALMTPGLAAADTTGHVAFSYNTLDDDFDGNKEDYLELNGAVATSLGGSWNLQFDGLAGDMNHDSHTDGHTTVLAHAFSRGEGYAFGGFGGFTNGNTDGYILGAEGALYLDRFTLAGSAFFGGDRQYNDQETTGFGGVATFFVSDNFSIGVDADYYDFDFGGGSEIDGTIYGVNAEYQFANAFSIFGGYHGSDHDYYGIVDKEVTGFTIGGRYNFGTATLIERDRHGASMTGGRQLARDSVFSW